MLFTPFYFSDGSSKNKFFLVISKIDGNAILASLPTSVNRAPALITSPHGCINQDERCFNCYLFQPGKKVCTNGFCFDLPTFIYGNDVENFEVEGLKAKYPTEGKDFKIVGRLSDEELNNLIECLKRSGSVKRKIKKLL